MEIQTEISDKIAQIIIREICLDRNSRVHILTEFKERREIKDMVWKILRWSTEDIPEGKVFFASTIKHKFPPTCVEIWSNHVINELRKLNLPHCFYATKTVICLHSGHQWLHKDHEDILLREIGGISSRKCKCHHCNVWEIHNG